jgi:hypothetical protein
MAALRLFLLLAFLRACLAADCSTAAEPKLSSDVVLAKWEAATSKVKTLDANVLRWKYDAVFSPNQTSAPDEGRFYYEAPNVGSLQIKSRDRRLWSWKGLSEMCVWSGKDTLLIDGERRSCEKYVWPEKRDPSEAPFGFMGILDCIRFPCRVLPLTLMVHAAEIRDRYRTTVVEQPGQYLVTALPKKADEAIWNSKIECLVDSKTFLTTAVQVYSPNGKDRVVWELKESKINERAKDRDQLILPDLKGLIQHASDFGHLR